MWGRTDGGASLPACLIDVARPDLSLPIPGSNRCPHEAGNHVLFLFAAGASLPAGPKIETPVTLSDL